MPSHSLPRRFIVLSGGTGRTAVQVLRAALAQFPNCEADMDVHASVHTSQEALALVRQAEDQKSLLCHSLVDPELREVVDTQARLRAIPCIDVLGSAIALLGDHLGTPPRGRAGLLYEIHHEQIDRMDAMDFTLAHDDGKRVWELKDADVVLVGASRTTKSVTCCYLAFRGVRAANVPLIPGQPPPKEMRRLSRRRVIGLTMGARHLEAIRQARIERITAREVPQYADFRDVQAELREIRQVMADHHWQCIDVSYKATEEVASQVISMLPKKRRHAMLPPRSETVAQNRS